MIDPARRPSLLRRRRAFTLIELLIVVAIIAILATIALPNFLEAQVRSKVSRAKADMRTLATGLESYAVDNNQYPPVPIGLGPRFRAFRPLTTPIPYLTTIPNDPFQSVDPNGGGGRFGRGMYNYGTDSLLSNASAWILSSDGPDRRATADRLSLVAYPGYLPGLFAGAVPGYNYILYDPTNGTVSVGDIFRASDAIF